jgi:hypothetical protein
MTKEINRAFYTQFPSADDRKKVNDKEKRLLKAWYRKYPTQAGQQAHPFETFVPELSLYQIIRDAFMGLLEGWNIRINSKDHPRGQLSAKSYMPLVQKLTGKAYLEILRGIYNLPSNYNFETDVQGTKTKRVRKNTTRILTEKDAQGKTFMERYLKANGERIFMQEIPQAVREVDANKGVLTVELVNDGKGGDQLGFVDASLQKGPKTKKFTKAEMAGHLTDRTIYAK